MKDKRLENTNPGSGKRIQITSDTNNMHFFDDSDVSVVCIDDDSAIEYGPAPAYTQTPGPGIRIGVVNSHSGWTTLGRQSIQTTATLYFWDSANFSPAGYLSPKVLSIPLVLEGNVQKITNANHSCHPNDRVVIMVLANTSRTVYLPPGPVDGQRIKIVNKSTAGTPTVTIDGFSKNIINMNNASASTYILTSNKTVEMVFYSAKWEVV